MTSQPLQTILVVTDHARPDPDLLAVLERRAADGPLEVTVLRINPARAEGGLLHPERHPAAVRAAVELESMRSTFEEAAGRTVGMVVSVRHDAFEAVEEHLAERDAGEIILAMPEGGRLAHRLHHDLAHRIGHLGRRVTSLHEAPVPH